MHSPSNPAPTLLERAWNEREEVVYPALFGPLEATIAPLGASLFHEMFDQSSIDPRWLHVGVMVAPPNPSRASWLYVSSGLSNPWNSDEPREYSGLGREFVFETTERADWPILRLQHAIAFELLLSVGRYPGHEPLDEFDRLPLRGPITLSGDSRLSFLLVVRGHRSRDAFELESGAVELFTLVGITEGEAEFARERGGEALLVELRRAGACPVTDPARRTAVPYPGG